MVSALAAHSLITCLGSRCCDAFVSAATAAGPQQTLHLSSLQGAMMTRSLLAFTAPPVCPDELPDGTHVLEDLRVLTGACNWPPKPCLQEIFRALPKHVLEVAEGGFTEETQPFPIMYRWRLAPFACTTRSQDRSHHHSTLRFSGLIENLANFLHMSGVVLAGLHVAGCVMPTVKEGIEVRPPPPLPESVRKLPPEGGVQLTGKERLRPW